jgi:hypothetical protein
MKVILGDCRDIPGNLAEPTLTATARDVTLSFDHLHEVDGTLRACRSPRSRQMGDYARPLFSCGSSTLHHGAVEMLKPDIWLAQHNEYYDLEGKRLRAKNRGRESMDRPAGVSSLHRREETGIRRRGRCGAGSRRKHRGERGSARRLRARSIPAYQPTSASSRCDLRGGRGLMTGRGQRGCRRQPR